MDARSILNRGLASGIRLGRGTADRVVRLAGPPLGKLTDKVASRVHRPEPTTTATFTPSKRTTDVAPATEAADPSKASPASVARNIGPPRPSASPARATRAKSVPGAKLPPPRPSTS